MNEQWLIDCRALYADHVATGYAAQIAVARAELAASSYRLRMMEENARQAVPAGHQIDLNDGKIKPSAECKPFPVEKKG